MKGDGVLVTCPKCGKDLDKRGLKIHVATHDTAAVEARFWSHVNKTDGCWEWTASLGTTGYGQFRVPGRRQTAKAHRFSYRLVNGPIPEGLTLDHLCRNRTCVRPDHLEPVTSRENYRRGMHPGAVAFRRGTCLRFGHPLTPLRSQPHIRRCMECVRIREAAQRAEQRPSKGEPMQPPAILEDRAA